LYKKIKGSSTSNIKERRILQVKTSPNWFRATLGIKHPLSTQARASISLDYESIEELEAACKEARRQIRREMRKKKLRAKEWKEKNAR